MTREQAFKEINETQEYYVDELVSTILNDKEDYLKIINFTSPTGTGKTNMMSLLCNKLPDFYFVITTLSKGQLHIQVRNNMHKLVNQDNFIVYGLCDYTANTRKTADDIISLLPKNKKIIWLRDEGHIHTNKWQDVLDSRCFKIINISATNNEINGINCNFTNTMMLRTVHQSVGTPEDALDKLLEVKDQHKNVPHYNPCAIMRCLDPEIEEKIICACEQRGLKYINITTEDFDMSDLCRDDNEYDVILNKFKIVEGIDVRRAHVVYMTNEPSNVSTTIQVIGRSRRNALLYRKDIDIFAEENKDLFNNTRQCFVFYNVRNMKVEQDETGELCQEFCDIISCQKLKPNSIIHVEHSQMYNGLKISELAGESGDYRVEVDSDTGFNIIKPEGAFYATECVNMAEQTTWHGYTKEELFDENEFPRQRFFNFATGNCDGEEYIQVEITDKDKECNLPYYSTIKEQIDEYAGNMYLLKKRSCPKKIAVDICKIKQNIELECFSEYGAIIEETQTTKHFMTEESANDFIESFQNEEANVNITYFSRYGLRKSGFYSADQHSKRITESISVFNRNAPRVRVWKMYNNYKEVPISDLEKYFDEAIKYHEYTKTINDRESAIVGTDSMKSVTSREGPVWIEDKAVTSKISKHSKFNTFIQTRYATQFSDAKTHCFNGKNKFDFDKKCNSCLGYCVEYYSKYLVYGPKYLGEFIEKAMKESKASELNEFLIVRVCMLKYTDNMKRAFGDGVAQVIKTISAGQLIKESYKDFVKTVISLANRTAEFVKTKLNITSQLKDGDELYDPNLSVRHISGLADYINEDTIIDIKTTNSIKPEHIEQVLAYHYLSTKRTDVNIKHVIVYDCVSGRHVQINL